MQTLLTPRTNVEQNEPATAHVIAPFVSGQARVKPSRNSNLDSLLKIDRAPQNEPAMEMLDLDPAPGVFLGLRIALLFNAGLGIAALLAYEAWTAIAR